MPEIKSSWASEVEEGEDLLNSPFEKIVGNNKIVTEYQTKDDNQKVKIVRTYKIDKKLVSKSIARRKALSKFGDGKLDRPGPDPATTIVCEEIYMQFIANKEESEKDIVDSDMDKLKKLNKGVVKCRMCKEDHWTTTCPYKDTLGPLRDSLTVGKEEEEGGDTPAPPAQVTSSRAYVPPNRRGDGARERVVGDTMPDRKRLEDSAAIRVSNLSENTQEGDLQELFKHFGSIARIFLSKDKQTGQCKGFAFIHYHRKEEAAKAISALNGYGYDHLILGVEWAKPTTS